MSVGLSRSLNLSEKELNLNEALQKLYEPGIEDDIDLFSLSSQIKSTIVSGKEDDGTEDADLAQILGLRSENLKAPGGTVLKRTKFQSNVDLYSNGDKVFFSVFGLTANTGTDVVNPRLSVNGSIPAIKVLTGGQGFYFNKPATAFGGGVQSLTEDTLVIKDVPLKGKISKSENARAEVTFKIDTSTVFNTSNVATWKLSGTTVVHNAGDVVTIGSTTNTLQLNANGTWTYLSPNGDLYNSPITVEVTYAAYQGESATATYSLLTSLQTGAPASGAIDLAPQGAPEYLTKWTGFYTRRYSVEKVVLTTEGTGYLIGEEVEILEGSTVTDEGSDTVCVLVRQEGKEYFGKEPIILTDQYYYEVRDASQNGMYLFDTVVNKFIYLATNISFGTGFNTKPREIKILRGDEIYVNNILQLRFTGSIVRIEQYGESFKVGDSITSAIYSLTDAAAELRTNSYKSIQNTKAPTPVTSVDNTLGFEYNRIVGESLPVYQRLIMRDQDWVLGTGAGGANAVTGAKLKGSVNMPAFSLTNPDIRVPGLFIKVGASYKRAYSTTDKPFFLGNATGTGVLNPDVSTAEKTYAVYAADQDDNGQWYAFNTTLSKFAQRIAMPAAIGGSDNGKNGAFYFHRAAAPSVNTQTLAGKTYYEIPLFTYVG
tara:strand:- start:3812 stop:5773 length:1962 start_codon:yes stop_codon:yes gene_type:complete